MSEEQDSDEDQENETPDLPPIRKQLEPLNGVERKAVGRRVERVKNMMHGLPEPAQQAIKESIDERAADEQ
jgi:phospholipid/cholesterol/gamma-HCH transport system ATP-binding protein